MNTFTEPLKEEICLAAQAYTKQGVVVPLPVAGYQEYLTTGNRLTFEQSYFQRRRQLSVLGLSVYLTAKPNEVKLLEQVLWEVCNEYTWALPAHLPLTGEGYGKNSPVWLDLFAAETAQTLAELLELVGPQLSPLVFQRVTDEIDRRIFCSLEGQRWDWETKENNWSSVVAGCIGMAALSVLPKEGRRLMQIIERLDAAMQSYLRGFQDDGACVEGVGYWGYGFGYYIYYAEKLARELGDQRYLQHPKAKAIAAFPSFVQINEWDYVPFSDYSRVEPPSGLVSFCGDVFGVKTPSIPSVSTLEFDHCYRFAHLSRNLMWSHPQKEKNELEAATHYFEDAQWLALRDPKAGFFFAAKGGTNDESHIHLDVGHFVLGDGDTLFLTDLGAGEYTRDYFVDAKRYGFFPTTTESHSVPLVNGEGQRPGPVAAREVVFDAEPLCFQMELSAVYGHRAELQSFVRRFTVVEEKAVVYLRDVFSFEGTSNRVIESFVSHVKPVIRGQQVLLTGKSSCELTFSTDRIKVVERTFQDHGGNEQTAYLIQVAYEVGAEAEVEVAIQIRQ